MYHQISFSLKAHCGGSDNREGGSKRGSHVDICPHTDEETGCGRSDSKIRALIVPFAWGTLILLLLVTSSFATEPLRIRYRTPLAPQDSCGADSLYVCLRCAGYEGISLALVENQLPLTPRGVSVASLSQACQAWNIPATAFRMEPSGLLSCDNCMILHVNEDHFVAFLGTVEGRLLLFDNGIGLFECAQDHFRSRYKWDGDGLIVGRLTPYMATRFYGRSGLYF